MWKGWVCGSTGKLMMMEQFCALTVVAVTQSHTSNTITQNCTHKHTHAHTHERIYSWEN